MSIDIYIILGQNWTEDICKDIPNHWEIHGDLALIPDTAFTLPVWGVIGEIRTFIRTVIYFHLIMIRLFIRQCTPDNRLTLSNT